MVEVLLLRGLCTDLSGKLGGLLENKIVCYRYRALSPITMATVWLLAASP